MDNSINTHLNQSQHMVLSQRVLNELKILQMSNQELVHYIEEEIIENPLLDDEKMYDYLDSVPNEKDKHLEETAYSDMDDRIDFTEYTSRPATLRQHLFSQLGEYKINPFYKRIACLLIENINEDGYLAASVQDIVLELNIPSNDVKKALKIIQSLDPAGVGARNIKECIILQLARKGQIDNTLKDIVLKYLELLAERKYSEISKKTGLLKEYIIDVHNLIKGLNPKPGQVYSDETASGYIVPELTLKEFNGNYIVVFCDESIVSLKVNDYYKKLSHGENSSKVLDRYIKTKMSKAIWLINAIEQRKRTILNVADCIVKYQYDFIKKGHMFLKPLTMKAISDKLGLHESTISRTVNGKYIQTPRGIFELKFFFSSQINSRGYEDISSNGVKKAIKDIIRNEDKLHPLSDEQVRKVLEKQGVIIARRTVAKYREELSIPPANLRKS